MKQRRQVYDWIKDLSIDLSIKAGKTKIDPAAWRVATRTWLEKNKLIIIYKPARECKKCGIETQ